nr:hypothetical protein [uncultured Agathobaculum sp.]
MSKTLKVKKNKKVEITKVFREPVRLLRETATPKKYARRFYQHEDRKKANKYNRHYIRIACGSQEPVICDKTYQMDENGLATDYEDLKAGVLRIEVHYGRGKLKSIEDYAGTTDPLDSEVPSRERFCCGVSEEKRPGWKGAVLKQRVSPRYQSGMRQSRCDCKSV